MNVLTCDAKGRISLRKSIRDQYGTRFVAVTAPGKVILLPVPCDATPRMLQGVSLKKLKALIAEEAQREVEACRWMNEHALPPSSP